MCNAKLGGQSASWRAPWPGELGTGSRKKTGWGRSVVHGPQRRHVRGFTLCNAEPGHVGGSGRTHAPRTRPLACSPRGAGSRGQAAVRRGRAPPPPASGSRVSSPALGVTRCGVPTGPFPLWASASPRLRSRRVRGLGPARPEAHRPPRGGSAARRPQRAPPTAGARTRTHLAPPEGVEGGAP